MCGIYISFFMLMLTRAKNTAKLLSFKTVQRRVISKMGVDY